MNVHDQKQAAIPIEHIPIALDDRYRSSSKRHRRTNLPRRAPELANLHRFVEKLESGYFRIRRKQRDVPKIETDILKREIANLERSLTLELKERGCW
jgi:hypothetical protein